MARVKCWALRGLGRPNAQSAPPHSVPENWEPDVENLSQNFEVKRKEREVKRAGGVTTVKQAVGGATRNPPGGLILMGSLTLTEMEAQRLGHHSMGRGQHGMHRHGTSNSVLGHLATALMKVVPAVVMCGMLCSMLVMTMGLLLGWHVYLVLNNKTTIEYHEGVRARGQQQLWVHPYDLGLWGNLYAVFGPHADTQREGGQEEGAVQMLLPTHSALPGDGLQYDMRMTEADPSQKM
eukprot:gene21698-26099_t